MLTRLPHCLIILSTLLATGCTWSPQQTGSRTNRQSPAIPGPVNYLPAPAKLSPGTFRDSLSHDSRSRTFVVHVPPSYNPDTPTPVVLMFHGFPGSGSEFENITGMDQNSDHEGFIVVYPDGFGTVRLRTWNAGTCCGPAMESNIDDVGFVSSLIDYLSTKANVDPKRVYAAGMSNGAMLCHRLGCELSARIAAIGAVSGTIMIDSCSPSQPVPIIMIHGTDDAAVPWNGGEGSGLPGLVFTSVPRTVEIWKKANRCTGDRQTPYMEMAHMIAEYQGDCPDGADVVLCTIEGGTHLWPGPISFIVRFLHEGVQSNPREQPIFSANEILWKFFQEHPMQ